MEGKEVDIGRKKKKKQLEQEVSKIRHCDLNICFTIIIKVRGDLDLQKTTKIVQISLGRYGTEGWLN